MFYKISLPFIFLGVATIITRVVNSIKNERFCYEALILLAAFSSALTCLMISNLNINKSPTVNGTGSKPSDAGPAIKGESASDDANDTCDLRGSIVYNGITYNQITGNVAEGIISKLHTDKYIGNAKSFEGTYRDTGFSNPENSIDGKVYTVKEHPILLLVFLDNSGTVLLKMEE